MKKLVKSCKTYVMFKGFAAELHFEEQFTAPRTFKLKIAFVKGYHMVELSQLNPLLHEKDIQVEQYYLVLRIREKGSFLETNR